MVIDGVSSGVDQLYLVSKFEPNGDLFDLVQTSVDGLPTELAKVFF